MSGYSIKFADTLPFDTGRNVVLPPIEIACDAGKVPVSGGHEMLNPEARKLVVMKSLPVNDGTFSGWRLVVENAFAASMVNDAVVRVFVVCAQMAQ